MMDLSLCNEIKRRNRKGTWATEFSYLIKSFVRMYLLVFAARKGMTRYSKAKRLRIRR
jgi:hypothetical protein